MRINNDGVQNLGDSSASTSVSGFGSGARQTTAAVQSSSDHVYLSNGSNLVSLAKSAVSSERQAKLSQLKEQVSSGQYDPDLSEVSHAIVQGVL